MRILLSTLNASSGAAHGGPVVAHRQAEALARRGVEVRIAATQGAQGSDRGLARIERYEPHTPPSQRFAAWRPNASATAALRRIIDRFDPEVVYDVHGPAWAVEAAVQTHRPVVSMLGDYSWYCRRNFLVDSANERCSGPETQGKCFRCINRGYPAARRMVQAVLRQAAVPAPAPLRLWDAVRESSSYTDSMRAQVDRFIVGDRKAHAFLLEHGIAAHKLVRIAQCLPDDALAVRRRTDDRARPAIDRALRIGFVGRVDAEKGIHVLARAFEGLPESAPVELWLMHATAATAGLIEPFFADRARFRMQVASGRIRLFQPEGRDALYRLMASLDVGVVPSLAFESPSLVLLELVAQRTPIVRSESEGMAHVIQDGVNGRTFPYGDWKALRNVLLEVIEEPAVLDRWRARLPAIGRDADYARELIEVFEAVIAKSGAPLEEAIHA